MSNYTIRDIEEKMTQAGSFWWSAGAFRFFGTRVNSSVEYGPGGIYFTTSEQPPSGPRRSSVRRYDPETNDISTAGDFCAYTPVQARRLAKELAAG